MALCLVRVTQMDSACLKDSCKSSELSNLPGLTLEAVRNTLEVSPAASLSQCRVGTQQSLSFHALAVLWGWIQDGCSELHGGRSPRTFCTMVQCCISLLLLLVPASCSHAVSVVGNGPLEVSEVGLGASWKSHGFHCRKASVL